MLLKTEIPREHSERIRDRERGATIPYYSREHADREETETEADKDVYALLTACVHDSHT